MSQICWCAWKGKRLLLEELLVPGLTSQMESALSEKPEWLLIKQTLSLQYKLYEAKMNPFVRSCDVDILFCGSTEIEHVRGMSEAAAHLNPEASYSFTCLIGYRDIHWMKTVKCADSTLYPVSLLDFYTWSQIWERKKKLSKELFFSKPHMSTGLHRSQILFIWYLHIVNIDM